MAEIRITILGARRVFRGILKAAKRGVEEYNRGQGTDHTIGEVVLQEGIGGVDRFVPPHILLSTARVGAEDQPIMTFPTLALIMKPVQGVMNRRIFLIDEIEKPEHREAILQFFHMEGLGDQVCFCYSLDQASVDEFRLSVFRHLLTLLTELEG